MWIYKPYKREPNTPEQEAMYKPWREHCDKAELEAERDWYEKRGQGGDC